MKSTPFEPDRNFAPIPFTDSVKLKAKEMKDAGLKWIPHVGCFVWDEHVKIRVPSPFPGNIYFVLNLNHFLKIFTSKDEITENLVWLPTWYQSMQILKDLGDKSNTDFNPANGEKDFIRIYSRISRILASER